jgi:hypothetical protein
MSHPLAISDLPLGEDFLKGIKGLDDPRLDEPQQSQRQPFGYLFRTIIEPEQARLIIKDMKYDSETQLAIGTFISRDGTIQAAGGGGTEETTETWETCATSLDGMFILDSDHPFADFLEDK